ncbi:hypothetical protein C8R43DRAFT_1138141 [Mycena crocata]|nr:hypothetical protein C8R43DRAFT_1138141 [Mycena crocata]
MTQHPPSASGTEAAASVPAVAQGALQTAAPTRWFPVRVFSALFGYPSAAPTACSSRPTPAPPHATGPWTVGVVYSVVPPSHILPVSHDNGELWYGILKGKYVGVTQNHPLALQAVVGISHNSMKAYKSQALAVSAFNDALDDGLVEVRSY